MNTQNTQNQVNTLAHPTFLKDQDEKTLRPKLAWLADGGEIADFIRAKDWSKSPLGPIENWSQSLRTTINLCLASNFPINIIWGPEAIQIYNSGYKVLCGNLNLDAIGESFHVTWESAWPVVGESFERARLGKTSFLENQRMFLFRNGFLEETFFTFSLSPIRDEEGMVVGVFNPATETTTAVLNQRRTRLLRDISVEAANSDGVSTAVERIARTLEDYKFDIPGALVLLENESGNLEIAAKSGDIDAFIDLTKWPIDDALETCQPYFINNLISHFGEVPGLGYQEPVQRACLLPIKQRGRKRPIGLIAATLSTRLPFNETYMAFFDLLNSTVNAAIANAEANESALAERTEFQTDIFDLQEKNQTQDQKEKFLIESKFQAEAATRSKSAFLANMSHEIRTPLASILGFTEILKSPRLSVKEHTKYLNIISRNGHALVRIIDDILDLSKIEADKIQLEQSSLCLTELIQDVLAMFSDRAKGKGLTLNFESNTLPQFKVESDAVRIRQILINLFGNAIKFTSEGSISIGGNYKEIENERYQITLRITDTGIGITSEQAATLFQAFTQADNTTTRHYGGTGLGLALSKKLAKAMGGDIQIEKSISGHGTTFLVQLIVKKSLDRSDVTTAPVLQVTATQEKQLQGWHILVVDDLEDNRVLIRLLLERQGAVVHEAANGKEGIRIAQANNYDVILMDIQMPDLDGYEALAKLRRANYKKPIFALTAHTMKEERDRALAAGFTGHIAKPINPVVLVQTLVAHARRLN